MVRVKAVGRSGLLLLAVLLAPLAMPILSPSALVSAYGESTLQGANSSGASGETGPISAEPGDRLGWARWSRRWPRCTLSSPAERAEPGVHPRVELRGGERGQLPWEGNGAPPDDKRSQQLLRLGAGLCTGQVLDHGGGAARERPTGIANTTWRRPSPASTALPETTCPWSFVRTRRSRRSRPSGRW